MCFFLQVLMRAHTTITIGSIINIKVKIDGGFLEETNGNRIILRAD